MIDEIHCGDNCVVLRQLDPESVHLAFGSPPYNCGVKYDAYSDEVTFVAYYWQMVNWLRAVHRVLVPGGRFAINIPMVIRFDGEIRCPLGLVLDAAEKVVGFKFRDLIVWAKGADLKDCVRNHTTNWGTFLSPKNPSVRSFAEFVVVLYKGDRGLDGEESDLIRSEWPVLTNNLWCFQGTTSKHHPAVFPEELARRVIKLFCYVGQTVLDPWCGIGTTCVVAKKLKRRYVGIDVSSEYCRRAQLALSKSYNEVHVTEQETLVG